MTLERDADAEIFGLAGSFPRPGWVVLNAARNHRFTGELVFEVLPEVCVYLDRGEIYLAERSNDAALSVRLVEAGVLSEVQRDRGVMDVGDGEHLGRLFERVPSVDRDAVLVITEMMNDECVSWLAAQEVRGLEAVPYRRHVSGIHRWVSPGDVAPLQPGDPLPAPPSSATPAEPLETVLSPLAGHSTDDLVRWDEPSWLDARVVPRPPVIPAPPAHSRTPSDSQSTGDPRSDWIDRLATDGLPERGDDPLSSPAPLPHVAPVVHERFELIWPSGDVDESFGAVSSAQITRHPDHDRTGPTVRVGAIEQADPPSVEPAVWEFEPGSMHAQTASSASTPAGERRSESEARSESSDDVVLAVRRAVASIETGSLDARRRLANDSGASAESHIAPPGRAVVAERGTSTFVSRSPSVFGDDLPMAPAVAAPASEPPSAEAVEPERVSALRRLIGGLRRR